MLKTTQLTVNLNSIIIVFLPLVLLLLLLVTRRRQCQGVSVVGEAAYLLHLVGIMA